MNAAERQPIAIVRDALTPEQVNGSKDEIEHIFAALDAALDAHKALAAARKPYIQTRRESFVTLASPELSTAEYALRLWSSAHGLTLREDESRYDEPKWIGDSLYRHRIRTLKACVGEFAIASVQFPPEPLDTEPRVLIDADQMWSPSQGERL